MLCLQTLRRCATATIFTAAIVASGAAFAGAKDYRFEMVGAPMKSTRRR